MHNGNERLPARDHPPPHQILHKDIMEPPRPQPSAPLRTGPIPPREQSPIIFNDILLFQQKASGQHGRSNPLRMDLAEPVLFDSHLRRKHKALLADLTLVNLCVNSNLENAARHPRNHLADVIERNINKYRGSYPSAYSLVPIDVPTCREVGPDVHALIKELAMRRVGHRSEIHSDKSRHLVGGTEVAGLRQQFYFVLQQTLSIRT